MLDFLQMGGHGGYIWASYGLATAIFVGFLLILWRRKRRLLADDND